MRRPTRVVQIVAGFDARPAQMVTSSVLDAATLPGHPDFALPIAGCRCRSITRRRSECWNATVATNAALTISHTAVGTAARAARCA